jgi:replicative DNA helicase
MFLFRPEYYFGVEDKEGNNIEGQADLIVAKQRNGPVGTVPLFFHKAYTRFDSREREYAPASGGGPSGGGPGSGSGFNSGGFGGR